MKGTSWKGDAEWSGGKDPGLNEWWLARQRKKNGRKGNWGGGGGQEETKAPLFKMRIMDAASEVFYRQAGPNAETEECSAGSPAMSCC